MQRESDKVRVAEPQSSGRLIALKSVLSPVALSLAIFCKGFGRFRLFARVGMLLYEFV